MNHSLDAAAAFVTEFTSRYSPDPEREVVIFPPALSLAAARAALDGTATGDSVRLGVQNVHWEDHGAFTGELSAGMARDAGATYVLVGHSERRRLFGETDATCAAKCAAAERNGITPILCVGETLDERERGDTRDVVLGQLRAGLGALQRPEDGSFDVAYEPVWAIGTGRTATPTDASEIHRELRAAIEKIAGPQAQSVRILYGGSVTATNAAELLRAQDVDGLLVGGASLAVDSWLSICHA